MKKEEKLLITLLRIAITGNPEPLAQEVNWERLLHLADLHKVIPLIFDGLQKSGADLTAIADQQLNALRMGYMHAIFQSAQLDQLRTQLNVGLCSRHVPHIFLKGAVLKYDYPIPALRTMSDLDILVHTQDYDAIDALAAELSGKPIEGDGNHKNFVFPGKLCVEFHPNLLHHDTPVGTQINPGWQYAKPVDGCGMELTEEGFYLNTICHLANHFVDGGVGVRFVLDVWVNRHLRKAQADRTFVEQELERFGLLEFAEHIEALADCWFGGGKSYPLLADLEEYILTSGSYGSEQRAMLNAIALSEGGSSSSALMGRLFYSREEMEDRFPWVKGKPYLLPAAWCVRAYRAVTNHGGLIRDWVKGTRAATKEEITQRQDFLRRSGIRRK